MLSSIYLNSLVMYLLSKSVSSSKHARNCDYLSKSENSSCHQEFDL